MTKGLLVPLSWFSPGQLPEQILKRELGAALEEEDYEKAAALRDFMNTPSHVS